MPLFTPFIGVHYHVTYITKPVPEPTYFNSEDGYSSSSKISVLAQVARCHNPEGDSLKVCLATHGNKMVPTSLYTLLEQLPCFIRRPRGRTRRSRRRTSPAFRKYVRVRFHCRSVMEFRGEAHEQENVLIKISHRSANWAERKMRHQNR